MKAGLIFLLALIFSCYSVVFAQKAEDPVAVDDSVTMMQYATIHINVLANDYDPNGEAIHIDDVDEEEGFEISFQDSMVTIKALIYYDWDHLSIDYRIRNESGESDRADIDIYFTENPEVPVPVRDIFDLECQTVQEMNLVNNDIYAGSEELIIAEIDLNPNVEVEILEDQKRVRLKAGINSGTYSFGYRLKEAAGNEYISKMIYNYVYIRKNHEVPIVVNDTFYIKREETKTFDVLANDISNNDLSIHNYSLPEQIEVIDNKFSYSCPIEQESHLYFVYQATEIETNYITKEGHVIIYIEEVMNKPIAMDDEFVLNFADTVYMFPLLNDSNLLNSPLVLENGETSIRLIYNDDIAIHQFNKWYDFHYKCKNENADLLSNDAIVRYRIKPPDSIYLEEVEFHIKMGEELVFNPRDYTNLPDSISCNASIINDGPGSIIQNDDDMLTFHFEPELLPDYFYYNADSVLYDIITCSYSFEYNGLPQFIYQYFKVKCDIPQNYSFLDVNHFNIPVSPLGMHSNNLFQPKHKWVKEEDLLNQIRPWISNEHMDDHDLQFSGDYYATYYGFDFFSGPIAEQYTEDYEARYFRTWEITKEQIDHHILNYEEQDYMIPEVIENWPAGSMEYHGNVYERADYNDVNENNQYDPENGDFPKISGDEAILYIINDGRFSFDRDISYELDSLNVDIYALVYAFNRPESDLFQNTFFMRYKLINKSNIDYPDFRFSQWLRYHPFNSQHHLGCDTSIQTFYSYPRPNIQSQFISTMTFLNQEMGKFLTFGDVDNFPRYLYANMMGLYDDEFMIIHAPLWYEHAPLNYVFPSELDDPDGWSAFTYNEGEYPIYTGYAGVASTEAVPLYSGESQYYEFAFSVNYQPDDGLFELVDGGLDRAAQLIECYQNDSVPGGGSFTGLEPEVIICYSGFNVYPNPASTTLYVEGGMEAESYAIFTLQGQLIEESVFRNEISIEYLPKGFYLLQLRGEQGDKTWTTKFVKQ